MKKLSKILSVLLCLAMIVGVVAVMVGAEESTETTYTKVTSGALTSGKYVLVCSNGYAPAYFENGWVLPEQPVVSEDGNTVTDAKGAVWTLTVIDESNVSLTDSNGVTIAPKSGNSNGIQSKDYKWAYSYADGLFKFAGQGSDTTTFACNTDSNSGLNRFRSYKNGTLSGNTGSNYISEFTLYKLDESSSEGTTEEDTTESTTEATPALPEAGSTLTIAEAIAIAPNADADTKYYITGEITSITSTTWGNMYIEDETGSIYIYGLYDEEGNRYDAMETKPAVGDTITVYTILSTFYDTPQAKNATLTELVPGEVEVDVPEDGSTLTVEEALAIAPYSGDNKYYITGEVTGTYRDTWATYGNLYITDETGEILIYGLFNEDGTVRYDAMEVQPIVGDTITVYTALTTYNQVGQAKNAWLTELVLGEGHEEENPEESTGATEGTEESTGATEGTEESTGATEGTEESTGSNVSGDTGTQTPGDTLTVFVGLLAVSTVGLAVVTSKKKEF